MPDELPTVTIEREGKPVRINASDYNKDEHKLWKGKAEATEEKKKKEADDTPKALFSVTRNGARGAASKFIVVDKDGNKHGDEEYANEADAQTMAGLLIAQADADAKKAAEDAAGANT